MSNHFVANQTGGSHYQDFAIQPWEYNIRNNIPWPEGEIIKYVSRWRDKNGLQDLQKAKDVLEAIMKHEIAENPPVKREPLVDYSMVENEFSGSE